MLIYRLKGDPNHALDPSYRTLFSNVDKTVNNEGYLNSQPLHLKTLTIAGLPVEEIPCVEVWDLSGKIFSSHVGWKHTNMCTWNAEYGDGYFRVSQNIVGDFAVICRFGGHLANTKDKSTLIFKYQNSTGNNTTIVKLSVRVVICIVLFISLSFVSLACLAGEVMELKAFQVDINPQYADSLDIELFTIHLMLEDASIATGINNSVSSLTSSSGSHDPRSLLLTCLSSYSKAGTESFEAGLDEVIEHFTYLQYILVL